MVVASVVLVGGCSADVTRFDFPFFGLTSKDDTTGSLPTPSEPIARNERYDNAPPPPPRGAGLSDTGPGRAYTPPPQAGSGDRYASRDYAPPPGSGYTPPPAPAPDRYSARRMDRSPPPRERPTAGQSIEVQQGDTLYGIAKRYGVSISALIELNGLNHGASIKPGQQLYLPAGVSAARIAREHQRQPAAPAVKSAPPATAPQAAAAPMPKKGWEGQHTVKAGESLYGIARQYRVGLAELQRVNGIESPTKVRVGTVLSVPGNAASEQHSAPAAARRVAETNPVAAPGHARIINAPAEHREHKVAALSDRRLDAPAAPPSPAEAAGKFRWPARGRVIGSFGKRTDGTHNDGINIALPQGTDVHAAEAGRVAYAGNELKGYGNLVLIRHDNGWVSAYAHADQVLVKRDDLVKRGQVIAKAGKTGTVDQPQLHFELRQGAKPVDPLPHLEK
jgi:murein DD-endopeptidase MepM/ murein hydrolase activator NlpD